MLPPRLVLQDVKDAFPFSFQKWLLDVQAFLVSTPGGVLSAAGGGTGIGSYAVGDLLYASATATLAKLAGVATGNALISGGVGAAPAWGKVALTTHISGVLPVANGGTNLSSFTVGDLLYASGTTALSKLADVAVGQVLVSGGVGVAPSWSGSLTLSGTLTTLGGATFHTTSSALTDGAGVGVGTLTTAPAGGDPTKWIGINDNGTIRYIPAW